jgi:hypothetical protein
MDKGVVMITCRVLLALLIALSKVNARTSVLANIGTVCGLVKEGA